jgi:hypothetical protein
MCIVILDAIQLWLHYKSRYTGFCGRISRLMCSEQDLLHYVSVYRQPSLIFWTGTPVSEISGTSKDDRTRIEQMQIHFEFLVHFDVQVQVQYFASNCLRIMFSISCA